MSDFVLFLEAQNARYQELKPFVITFSEDIFRKHLSQYTTPMLDTINDLQCEGEFFLYQLIQDYTLSDKDITNRLYQRMLTKAKEMESLLQANYDMEPEEEIEEPVSLLDAVATHDTEDVYSTEERTAFMKEEHVWFQFYLAYDDNPRHAKSAFHNNGYSNYTAEQLHKVNVSWIQYFLDCNTTPDELVKWIPAAKPYVEEYSCSIEQQTQLNEQESPDFLPFE